ncbi:MAG: hypothetical protein J7539_18775, partial [Niabella sp.]|nr:hypothetical protein [Niabella sp.]
KVKESEMDFKLNVGENKKITVAAKQEFSDWCIKVLPNEQYLISCSKDERWKDWFINTSAEGYCNPLAILVGLRVKHVKCFCLCGAYNRDDKTAFEIGLNKLITIPDTIKGTSLLKLYFFANDSKGYYWNNRGQIEISIGRMS